MTLEQEMKSAQEKYGHYNSTHEVASVLREEYEEFWELVKQSKQDGKLKDEMIKELTQIAAVALRAAQELTDSKINHV